ncbi:hypothetical protein [Roseimaritima sediminicola]|uniref:hypothetical protein n=1 Tax=Roseimaritima sediminicola TaxID=2662066 RepID=UPI001298582E|nr:hypothetical protein [Roseimaritima sediminicola]
MRFDIRSTYYPIPSEPDDYIRAHEVSILCACADEDTGEVVAGRVAVDYLDITRAEAAGQDICHICDADSQGWSDVYAATIEPATDFAEIRRDFEFDDPVFGLVFVHQAVLHRSLDDWRQMIFDSICEMFPPESATVMWKHTTEMTDKELASLGFRIVAGHNLLFRPNMLKHAYITAEDERAPLFDLQVPADAEDWVEEHWDPTDMD